MNRVHYSRSSGFTIVELLVVIVVIGILAAITIVAYTGISQKAVASALQSDLDNASKQLKLYQVDHSAYPVSLNTSNCPLDSSSNVDTNYCLKLTSGNSRIGYSANNSTSSQSFLLIAGNGNTNYQITNTTSPTQLAQTMQPNVTPGAVLELHAAKANNGTGPGINSPLTTTWKDTSGNGNNGTLTGFGGETPWAGAGGTPSDPYRLVFDGTDDYVGLPDLGASEDTVFALEAWASFTVGITGTKALLVESGSGPYFYLAQYSGIPYFMVRNDAYVITSISAGVAYLNDGAVHHIVGLCDGATLRLYVDGVARGQTPAVPAGPYSMTMTRVGAIAGSNYWPGSVPVVRIYPFALTPEQVAQNYAAGPDW